MQRSSSFEKFPWNGNFILQRRGLIEVNQTRYDLDILKKYDMVNCKPCKSPVTPGSKLIKDNGELIKDPTHYREMVGFLQYLSQNRPDITYVTNEVAQFLHESRISHLMATKRILRYLKASLSHGLRFTKYLNNNKIYGFSDADFAGDPNIRKSITGACIFVEGNLVT